ncbi:3,4-dihydroxy-2-butanone-4-phosphate synthase [Roseomonas sp. NAR14]|uniref:3,4-dihydroxy-2-butanone 4-phosphate synthase n=1 Tax=Roseomonas acroporae TaxID=2937791 RepID=A0A9X1Y660_9PROT|nr:3,4-dihydroxy-2-butanone-4-phosphate synthase [Roseomonas acroporae]MCK8783847.1 3,4-dihydroxy-2-butanone-4-phosphate synthase [Roseomonas acroporae]
MTALLGEDAARLAVRTSFQEFISPTEELLDEARRGRMFILVDDEDRENEGDLVIPAQFATPDAINFMARHARGLICLAMTRSRVEKLGLPLMSQSNGTRHETAFTVSIEAREGVTTGISAADRAHTIAVATNPELGRESIVTPGHVFPLVAREGGTLIRAGHTEASVDFARLAGLNPAGVICEIMNDDGSMARMPDLVAFAQHHGLKLGTIADLIAHRRRTERLVRRVEEGVLNHAVGGEWQLLVYASTLDHAEHVVLVKGDVADAGVPPLVRMHAVSLLRDMLGNEPGNELHGAMRAIAEEGRGVVVMIRDTRLTAISEQVRLRRERRTDAPELRDYGIGAQILVDLGVKEMALLSNHPRPIVGLEGYGLKVVETRPITAPAAAAPTLAGKGT